MTEVFPRMIALLLVLMPMLSAAPTAGQAPGQDVVPLELVEVLFVNPYGGDEPPEVLVGRLPEEVAAAFPLPDESRVIGSIVQPAFSISALATPRPPAEVRSALIEHLAGRGWERYQPPRPAHGGGFAGGSGERALQFCRGDRMLMLNVSAAPDRGSHVTIMDPVATSQVMCSRDPQRHFRSSESLIPVLQPPEDVQVQVTGGGGGGAEWDSDARLRTRMTALQLLEHYTPQLQEAGWTLLQQVSAPGIATATFRVIDDEGAEWLGVFTAAAPMGPHEEPRRFVSVRMDRLEWR